VVIEPAKFVKSANAGTPAAHGLGAKMELSQRAKARYAEILRERLRKRMPERADGIGRVTVRIFATEHLDIQFLHYV